MDESIPNDEQKPVIQSGKKLSLNFTDKDDKENAKFNDARLVDILRNYPLLYNKSLETYGDPDYTQWMWGEIANEMNEPHRKTTINLPFNWINCRDQWEVVKRALRYLSNPAAKSFRYPKQFRDCLDFFQNYIKDRREPPHTDRSQDMFINYANYLEQMPFEKQLLLQKEILDVILSNELEFCAPMVDPLSVEAQAREEFGKAMGLLMPEVDVHIVQNEMATESEPFVLEDFIQKTESVAPSESIQLVDLYSTSRNCLKGSISQFDLENLLQIPSSTSSEIIIPDIEGNVQYSVEEIIQQSDADNFQDVIEEDVIEDDVNEDVMQDDGSQEVVVQDSVYQEVALEEDLIEEVVPQGMGKDMPSLDLDGNFEVPVNRLDFACVLNEILE